MADPFYKSDLAAMFGEFGQSITWTSSSGAASFVAIFDNEYQQVDMAETRIGDRLPELLCRTSDVSGAVQGDTIVLDVDDVTTTYNVSGIEADGTGVTILRLSKD